MICPYCEGDVLLGNGKMIYPKRPDLHLKKFYICPPCKAWVGCHGASDRALGTIANSELRGLRQDAHKTFDSLWKSGMLSRRGAYDFISKKMGCHKDIHIGSCNESECKQIINIIKRVIGKVRAFLRKENT